MTIIVRERHADTLPKRKLTEVRHIVAYSRSQQYQVHDDKLRTSDESGRRFIAPSFFPKPGIEREGVKEIHRTLPSLHTWTHPLIEHELPFDVPSFDVPSKPPTVSGIPLTFQLTPPAHTNVPNNASLSSSSSSSSSSAFPATSLESSSFTNDVESSLLSEVYLYILTIF